MRPIFAMLLSSLLTLSLFAQPTYTTGFEPGDFNLGNVNGQNGWGHEVNSPTGGNVVAEPSGNAAFGAQSLAIVNLANNGVQNHLYSTIIDPAAGETGSTANGIPVVNPRDRFNGTVWVYLPAVPVASTSGTALAEIDASSKGANAPGVVANRYAVARLYQDANPSTVRVEIRNIGLPHVVVAQLPWGGWYRFEYRVDLIDGVASPTEPNDRFSLSIYDLAGNLVGSGCGSTWEVPWRSGSFGGTATPRAVNGFEFWTYVAPGSIPMHVDDISMSTSDLTGTLGVTVSGTSPVCFGATTTLTANVTGGSGSVTAYTWRDASNAIVGTNATLTAGAGTYTVEVFDGACLSATSTPFTVNEDPQLAVTISGAPRVCCGNATNLTANVSGGSGSIASYVWRDAENDVVCSTPTCNVGPGLYTVTVTDASCGVATSAVFAVAEAEAVPLDQPWMLIAIAGVLAMIAIVRMR